MTTRHGATLCGLLLMALAMPVQAQGFVLGYAVGSSSCTSDSDKDREIAKLKQELEKKDVAIRELNTYVGVQQRVIEKQRKEKTANAR